MTKDILLTLTYLVGIGELILGVFFWVTNSKSEIRKVMSIMVISTGLWVISNALTSYTNPSIFINVAVNSIFIFAIIFVLSLIYFSFIYPYPIFRFDKIHKLLFISIGIIYSCLAFFTKTIYSSYQITPNSPGILTPGPLFAFFQISIAFLFILAIILLIIRYNKIDGPHKQNLAILIASIVVGGVPAIILNLWATFFAVITNPLLAVLPSGFLIGGTVLIISRKK